MTSPAIVANSNVVIESWLKGVPGVPSDMVGGTVPSIEKWVGTGFVQHAVVAGGRHNHLPQYQPIVRFNTYATSASGSSDDISYKPRWNLANDLAEAIIAGIFNEETLHRELTLPKAYASQKCRIIGAYDVGEPIRLGDDAGGMARFTFTARFIWAVMP